MIKAECTWGEGSDIMLVIEDEEFGFQIFKPIQHLDKSTHGYMTSGAMDLTKEQARKLAQSLLDAVNMADILEHDLKDYVETSD